MLSECKICGKISDNKNYTVKEMMFGTKDSFNYFQCNECGCLQISEYPVNIQEYYTHEYYSFSLSEKIDKNKVSIFLKRFIFHIAIRGASFFEKILFLYLKKYSKSYLTKLLSVDFSSKILDVGCGSGNTLARLYNMGFLNLDGIDPYLEADMRHDCGINLYKKSIEEVDSNYDLIMMNHSLEHMPNHNKVFFCLSKILNSDGILLIRTPTVSSLIWRKYKENWVELDAPRHFFLHSIRSLELLAEKNGLFIEYMERDSVDFEFLGSELYSKGIPLYGENSYDSDIGDSVFTKNELAEFKRAAKEVNATGDGGRVCIVLRKARKTSKSEV